MNKKKSSPLTLISALLLGILCATLIVLSTDHGVVTQAQVDELQEKIVEVAKTVDGIPQDLKDLAEAVQSDPQEILERALETPEQLRSRIKNVINIQDPLHPGVGYEVARIRDFSADILAFGGPVRLGAGVAKDIPQLNMDIGVGLIRPLRDMFNSQVKTQGIIYLGVHF